MKRDRVIVTGGAGYIGSHTVVELYRAGYQPIIVDNLSNSSLEVLKGIERIVGERPLFEKIDCSDYSALNSLFKRYGEVEMVIHFAAYKAVGESVERPLLYYQNNLFSLINLLQLLSQKERGSIVFSSSCTVYGQPAPNHLPVDESAPLQPPQSPYGNTKKISEEILKETIEAEGGRLSGLSLRYFNPIGAHPSAEIGELPLGTPQNLLPYITQTAAGVRERLSVFGDNYNTPDGSAIRDYIYVSDLAKAHLSALEWLRERREEGDNKPLYETFNIGTGRGLSVFEVIDLFERANSLKIPYSVVERRAGDVEQVWADPTKANRLLNWRADTPLEEVMRSAWRWEQRVRG